MNEHALTPAQILTLVGRIKGLILTDLSETSYDMAILTLSNNDGVDLPSYKIKANPALLARQLGQTNSRPEHLREENRPEDDKAAAKFDDEVSTFLKERSTSARKWLQNKIHSLKGEYYRVNAENRIAGQTGYGDDNDNLTAHNKSGLYFTELEPLDDFEVADMELSNAIKAGQGTIQVKLNDVASFKNNMIDAAEKRRRERMAALTGRPVVATPKSEPAPEEPPVDEDTPEQEPATTRAGN